MCRPTPRNSVLCRTWFGLESALISVRSADIYPIHGRSKTDKPSTIGGRIKTDTSPNAPRQTDTTPIYSSIPTDNRQFPGRDLSNMFERSLPDKFVCPNINRHQTDKTESIPTVNWSLPEFDIFCRCDVGFVSFWPMWLGYKTVWSSPTINPLHNDYFTASPCTALTAGCGL